MSKTHSKSRSCEKRDMYFTTTTEPTTWTATDTRTMSASNGHTTMTTANWQVPAGIDSTEKLPLMDVHARRQIQQIGEHIYMIEDRLGRIEQQLNDLEIVRPRVVMLREIDEPTAEREIVSYLETHGEADTADLVENLGIDIDLVLAVVQRLKSEGSVERVTASSQESR